MKPRCLTGTSTTVGRRGGSNSIWTEVLLPEPLSPGVAEPVAVPRRSLAATPMSSMSSLSTAPQALAGASGAGAGEGAAAGSAAVLAAVAFLMSTALYSFGMTFTIFRSWVSQSARMRVAGSEPVSAWCLVMSAFSSATSLGRMSGSSPTGSSDADSGLK
jgi:hypothetical protein